MSVRETILKTFYNIFGCKMFYKSYNYAFQSIKTFSGLTKVFEFCSGDRFGFDY